MPRIQQSRAPKRRILGDISNISNTSMIDEDKPVKKLKNNKDILRTLSFEGSTDSEVVAQGGSCAVTDSESVDGSIQGSTEFSGYGFELPHKIQRIVSLNTTNSDPMECNDILDDIFGFFRIQSSDTNDLVDFTKLVEITPRMRAILLDWLMQVQYTIKLLPATLWLTVGILDRYLAISPHLKRDNLQLVGATALLLASKIEEHRAPALKCFVEWTEGVCQKKDIQQMEFTIMQALDYQLIVTTAHNFLRLYLHRIQATKRISYVAYYLAERMLLDASYFSYTAAVYAAGAVYAARFTAMYESGIQHVVWTEELVLESQLTAAEVLPCAAQMLRCARTPISPAKRRLLDTVHKKYATRQTQHVSEIDFPTLD